MISSTLNKGFTLSFNNGLTISIQFGAGNYYNRNNMVYIPKSEMLEDIIESETAEIAIWDNEDNWFDFGFDNVKGYLNANEVAEWINRVANAVSLTDLQGIDN